MTKAFIAGFIDWLNNNGNKNPFPIGNAYHEYETGYNQGYDIRIGDEVIGMQEK